jgi:hypothetical protein
MQISAEWKKPKETSRCTISYKAAIAGSAPWLERQFEVAENKEIVIGSSDGQITDGLERALEQVRPSPVTYHLDRICFCNELAFTPIVFSIRIDQ